MKRKIDKSIGLRIRKKREAYGYSRESMAELAEMSPTFLADIELGHRSFSFITLTKICKTLNVSADFILFGSETTLNFQKIEELLSGLEEEYMPFVEEIITSYMKSIALAKKSEKETA